MSKCFYVYLRKFIFNLSQQGVKVVCFRVTSVVNTQNQAANVSDEQLEPLVLAKYASESDHIL